MKKYLLFPLLFLSLTVFCQTELDNGLLFPDFSLGEVHYKNGSVANAQLNYNTMEEELLFKDPNGEVMAVSEPQNIGFVVINERIFVHIKNDLFYEVVEQEDGLSFYIQWKSKPVSEGKGSAYGGRSQASSITNVGTYRNRAGYRSLNLDEKFKVKVDCSYYLRISNSYKKINTVKSLTKLFKGHDSEIENYAKEQKIDFSKQEDIRKIVAFCSKLSKLK